MGERRIPGEVRAGQHYARRREETLPGVDDRRQVVVMLSDIGDLEGCLTAELPLNGQIPLVGHSGTVVSIRQVDPDACETGRGRGEHIRNRATAYGTEPCETLVESYQIRRDA